MLRDAKFCVSHTCNRLRFRQTSSVLLLFFIHNEVLISYKDTVYKVRLKFHQQLFSFLFFNKDVTSETQNLITIEFTHNMHFVHSVKQQHNS